MVEQVVIGVAVSRRRSACTQEKEEGAQIRTVGQNLTLEQDRVLSFETPSVDWAAPNGSNISLSTTVTAGAGSLQVTPNGYTELRSVDVDAPGAAANTATLDLQLPQTLGWGEVRLIARIPSQQLYWTDMGGVALAGLAGGSFHSLSFNIPSAVQAALNSSATDLSFIIVLNVASGSGQYLLDNLKVTTDEVSGEPSETEEELISIALPSGGDIRDYEIVASGLIDLRNEVTVTDNDPATAPNTPEDSVPIANFGSEGTALGVETVTGAITSVASVQLANNAFVHGDILTAGSIKLEPNAAASGDKLEYADIPAPTVLSWKQPIAANPSANETIVPNYGSKNLSPGSYSEVVVYSNATLHLSSGNYAFTSLQLEPQATLHLTVDEAQGPVVIYVEDVLAWRSETTPLDAEGLLVVYKGTEALKFERSVGMAIVAPRATVTLATGGLSHFGSVYAQGITMDPGVHFTAVPFKYWDWMLPPRPVANCIYPAGEGDYVAVFDYENPREVRSDVPLGVNNHFVPAAEKGEVITHFEPGEHREVLWAKMSGNTLAWEIHGQAAVVDLDSPKCDFETSRVEVPMLPHTRGFARPTAPPGTGTVKDLMFTQNAFGAGTWLEFVEPDDPLSWPYAPGKILTRTQAQVGDEDVTVPPVLELEHSGPRPFARYELELDAYAEKEGIHENADIRLAVTVGGTNYPLTQVAFEKKTNAEAHGVFSGSLPTGEDGEVSFEFREVDHFTSDEVIKATLFLDEPSGLITGNATYNFPHNKQEIFLTHVGDAWELSSEKQNKTNSISFTLRKRSPDNTDLDRPIRVCAYWPTGFWDDGPEANTGIAVPGSRLRAVPAAFARYSLTITSTFEETHPVQPAFGAEPGGPEDWSYLDEDGCIPEEHALLARQLVYDEDALRAGNDGGLDFYLRVFADFAVPAPGGGYSRFDVFDRSGVQLRKGTEPIWPPVPINVLYRLRNFGEQAGTGEFSRPWSVDNGFRVPPEEGFSVVGEMHNDGTNVAAVVSQSLRKLVQEGTALPQGGFPIEVDSVGATDYGAPDYSCRRIGDANYSETATLYQMPGIEIGRGMFPCGYSAPRECQSCSDDADCDGEGQTGICERGLCRVDLAEISECRRFCDTDEQCPGGQSCREQVVDGADVSPGDACVLGSPGCFCAWPGQGATKFATTHEMGHLIQKLTSGTVGGTGYGFSCPFNDDPTLSPQQLKEDCAELASIQSSSDTFVTLTDPPFTNPMCSCAQVSSSNAAHCLQSIEVTPSAQSEGYAQFFAAMVWNEAGTSCNFNYYKELSTESCDGMSVNDCKTDSATGRSLLYPPASVACDAPIAWRTKYHCNAFDTPPSMGTSLNDMSTEMDWMSFLLGVKQTMTFSNIMDVYRLACHPENDSTSPLCLKAGETDPDTGVVLSEDQTISTGCYNPELNCAEPSGFETPSRDVNGLPIQVPVWGRPLYWRDREFAAPASYPHPKDFDRGGFYDGAVRVFGDLSAEQDTVRVLGNVHAVSDGTTP